ncbi:MAG: PEP-utilizing enzyme [Pseudomonadota bacterium]
MSTLWFKFPDEDLLFTRFSDAEKKRLEDIFSAADENSPWNNALKLLKFSRTEEKMLFWHHDVPYFNWSALVKIVSGGAIQSVKAKNGSYGFLVSYKIRDLWRLLTCQWKIVRFLQRPGTADIAESIALGLVLQALVMRFGRDERLLAGWLAGSIEVPKRYRKTVSQIQAVQMRRTRLSNVWRELFPDRPDSGSVQENMPGHFWDAPPSGTARTKTSPASKTEHREGLSVCTGDVTGIAVPVTSNADAGGFPALKEKYKAPLVLVFRQARPETTEVFEHAGALLFAEGGILSHACTVARERNIPAVTALGGGFFSQISEAVQNGKTVWLSVEGGAGTVKVIRSPQGNDVSMRPTEES